MSVPGCTLTRTVSVPVRCLIAAGCQSAIFLSRLCNHRAQCCCCMCTMLLLYVYRLCM
jgi:hypothetical protein